MKKKAEERKLVRKKTFILFKTKVTVYEYLNGEKNIFVGELTDGLIRARWQNCFNAINIFTNGEEGYFCPETGEFSYNDVNHYFREQKTLLMNNKLYKIPTTLKDFTDGTLMRIIRIIKEKGGIK